MLTTLVFIITLSLLVFVHEAAHFLAARRAGVGVLEFGFGIPPRLWGKKIGKTVYSVNLLPLGGFVRLADESGAGVGVLAAGVVGNFLLGWFFLTLLFGLGNPRFSSQVMVEGVADGSPAESAGIVGGDVIFEVGGVKIEEVEELLAQTQKRLGEGTVLGVRTLSGERREVSVVPRPNPPEGEGALGVRVQNERALTYERHSWGRAPFLALKEAGLIIAATAEGVALMVRNLVISKEAPRGVAGVVGIYQLTGWAVGLGGRVWMQFVALLNFNLFLFNLLPIPALDGGRLLFAGLEAVTRRKIHPKWQGRANQLGLVFLGALFILITLQDLSRL